MKKLLLVMSVVLFAISSCGPKVEPQVKKAKITVTPTEIEVVDDFTATKELTITVDVDWTLTGLPEDGWVKADVTSGSGNGKVILTFNANTEITPRNAKLIFTNSDKRTAEVAVKQNGVKSDKPDADKVVMIAVEGGKFVMGNSDLNGVDQSHEVELSSFRISTYEITQKIYTAIEAKNPSIDVKGDNYPVTDVSWGDALIFCNDLSAKDGLTPAYLGTTLVKGSNGYRIPTEAQFEYAAMGGKKSNGKWYPGSDDISDVCVHSLSESPSGTVPGLLAEVGTKAPNELGIYDLGGNCWEWVWDYYADDFITPAPKDPLGPETGKDKVIRGGAFDSYIYNCSVFGRFYTGATDSWDDVSIRVVLPAEGATW